VRPVDKDTESLMGEVAALRQEVQQLRDLVRMLFEMMIEGELPDDELPPHLSSPFLDGTGMDGKDFKGLGM
jgi:hypothetical protein